MSLRLPVRAGAAALFALFLILNYLSADAAAAQRPPALTGIKHWSNPEYTRIVLTLTGKADFSHRLLKQDPSIKMEWRRLYVDIKGAVIAREMDRSVPINDGLLKMARAGQFDKETVRVVFDIESIEDFKVFPLSDPFRIVIDVTGAKKPEPKAAPPKTPQITAPAAERKAEITAVKGLKLKKIVVDPGHGGKDPGAIGKGGLKEKDVTLKISRMLGERLSVRHGAKVIMTRDTDVFIPLEERTAVANSRDADLFVSIHINASPKRSASGLETYILNVSQDEDSRRLAARENATTRKALTDLEFILNDLIKTAKTNDSVKLAESVQGRLFANLKDKYKGIKSNGVKGAPFYVLVGTKMPSILVEVSFISNPEEERRLRDEKYLEEVVEGITEGLVEYMNSGGQV